MDELTIQIILTGGTIDSYYNGQKDTAIPNEHSVIPEFLDSLRSYVKFEYTEVCMKDSRSLEHEDLQNILKTIENTSTKNIIITHGTYTMPDTARYIKANLSTTDKIIILTGSMIPLKGFAPSDAPFNLGYSIAQFSFLKPGIYICMNGKTFTSDEAAKNISQGKFYSIFNK